MADSAQQTVTSDKRISFQAHLVEAQERKTALMTRVSEVLMNTT